MKTNKSTFGGRVALVTGSSSGIGKIIALALAREGADVVICGRDYGALENVAEEIKGLGSLAYLASLDATKSGEVESFFQETIAKIGQLDILVNNIGGVRQFEEFSNLTDGDWQEAFDLNVMSTVRFTREAIPWLERSEHASIVNVASVSGKKVGNWNYHYCAAKAAQLNLTQGLSFYLGPRGIRVNAVCPSTVKGEGMWPRDIKNESRRLGITPEEAQAKIENNSRAKSPLGEICTPEDVAEAVVFLASDNARFITGTAMMVDGGTTRLA